MNWTPELWERFRLSSACALADGDFAKVYEHISPETGVTVFVVYHDGTIDALKDMLGERVHLDYCS